MQPRNGLRRERPGVIGTSTMFLVMPKLSSFAQSRCSLLVMHLKSKLALPTRQVSWPARSISQIRRSKLTVLRMQGRKAQQLERPGGILVRPFKESVNILSNLR